MGTTYELVDKAIKLCGDVARLCQNAHIPYDETSKRFDPRDHGVFPFEGLVFWLRPRVDGTRQARLFITCPVCLRHIPVGRFGQHVSTRACTGTTQP